jgi:hypothetical protein
MYPEFLLINGIRIGPESRFTQGFRIHPVYLIYNKTGYIRNSYL